MNYCPQCGAPTQDTPFCGNCGNRLDPSRSQRAPQGVPGEPPAAPMEGSTDGPQTALLSRTNPFADIAVSDYVRDLVALVLLLISFGMPWDQADTTTGKIYVILATLLSIVSLSVPYLYRTGVFPTGWGLDRVRLVRLAANLPYGLVVVITLILDYVAGRDADGVGIGLAFGFAGAVLAAQPRRAEMRPTDGPLWRAVTIGLGGVIALLSLVTLIPDLVDLADVAWSVITLQILVILFFVAVIGLPMVGFIRRDSGWRDVLVVLGAVGILAGFWQLSAESVDDAWRVESLGPAAVLWPGVAAAVTSPGVESFVNRLRGSARWVQVAQRTLELMLLVAVFGIVISAVELAADDSQRGTQITTLVLYLIIVAAALVGRSAVVRDARQGRPAALVVGGAFGILGIVLAAVMVGVGMYEVVTLSIVFVVSATVIGVLTIPKVVRDELAVVAPGQARPHPTVPSSASGSRPAPPPAGEPEPEGRGTYTPQIASDPATPLETLADIAATEPALRKYVAANPSTYPELLQWLSNLGDPEVDEALRGRTA